MLFTETTPFEGTPTVGARFKFPHFKFLTEETFKEDPASTENY
jgi:hypothetical protein